MYICIYVYIYMSIFVYTTHSCDVLAQCIHPSPGSVYTSEHMRSTFVGVLSACVYTNLERMRIH